MDTISRKGVGVDMGDTLAELGALSLSSRRRGKSDSDPLRAGRNGTKHRNRVQNNAEVDGGDNDVLLVGTSIRVKRDEEGRRSSGYGAAGQSTDSICQDSQAPGYGGSSNAYDVEDGYEIVDSSDDSDNMDGNSGHEMGDSAAGQAAGSGSAEEIVGEITSVPKMPHYSDDKPQTGFLLNFFRGKGAKATLKSIVKGKTVYNKVIDLDADNSVPFEFEDVNDALQHIASARSATSKAGSVSGSISNASSSTRRRRRDNRNAQRHRIEYNGPVPYAGPPFRGIGRMEPAPLGRYDFYGAPGPQTSEPAERQPMTPEVFNGWVRAFFNVAVTTVLLYLGLVFILAISRDIGNGLEKRRQMVKAEAMLCQELFRKNKCRTVKVPALEQQCRDWEACMYKDAILYDDASFLSAEVLGGVVNKFFSQLDARTVGIVLASFLALFVGSNCALSMSSSRSSSPGWFRSLFSRRSQPENGSDLLQGNQFAPNAQLMQVAHNPYMQPNYCVMGSYPYVNTGYYPNSYRSTSLNYYNDKSDEGSSWAGKSGHASAWKRRFMSPWVDME
ncbi:nucleus export protein BRR6, putative [Babesia caballi]|uniref:Nucleus export protein BRR6, putative n=1 Tax=Babesia caballi TaxID=5871 RepID=A0AAV4LSS5_BABCB|nr:nucleus export protein BRR6, putative [Babesia caballi]